MRFPSNIINAISDPKDLPGDFPIIYTPWIQNNLKESQFHYHNCLELGLCIKGSGLEMINNHTYSFSSDTLSIIHRDCPHDSQIPIKNDYMNRSEWHFIFADLKALNIPCQSRGGFISSNPALVSLFRIMYKELENKSSNYQAIITSLLSAFVCLVEREARDDQHSNSEEINSEINNIINYILHCYNEPITVKSLAQKCNLSESTFCRLFTRYTGTSPMNFVNHTRLEIAKNMLVSSNLSIMSIAESVGFNTLSSFNRLFLKENGYPPRTLRAINHNQSDID